MARAAPEADLVEALRRLRSLAPSPGWPLHLVSVRPNVAQVVSRCAVAQGLSPLLVAKRPVRRCGEGYKLSELGIDRLAAIEGYLALAAKAQAAEADAVQERFVLVVQAGTATTIDAVTTSGRHLGGLILPGLQTALHSLHEVASLLPNLTLAQWQVLDGAETLGHDTRSAMLRAAVQMTIGAIERVRSETSREHRLAAADPSVYLSGGHSALLAPLLPALNVPGLVLDGARAMVLGGTF